MTKQERIEFAKHRLNKWNKNGGSIEDGVTAEGLYYDHFGEHFPREKYSGSNLIVVMLQAVINDKPYPTA